MSQIIAARKPYYNEQFADEFNWWIKVISSKPTYNESTLLIIKRSPTIGISMNLRLNVAPLAKDYFRHTPELTLPTTIQSPTLLEPVTVNLTQGSYTGTIYATYSAYDGWVEYLSNTIGVSNMNITKKIGYNSPQYISAIPFDTNNITWLLDDGNFVNVVNTHEGTEDNIIFPVIHPSLTIDNTINGLTVIGKNSSNVELWRLEYEFVCPFDESHTIGFVNKYGVWEFIDVTGRRKSTLKTERKTYTRSSDGISQDYAVNGHYEYEFNSGWVDKGFEDVIEGLLLSEAVIIYKGDGLEPEHLTIDTNSMDIQDSRADRMINYNFKAKVAKPIIDIQ